MHREALLMLYTKCPANRVVLVETGLGFCDGRQAVSHIACLQHNARCTSSMAWDSVWMRSSSPVDTAMKRASTSGTWAMLAMPAGLLGVLWLRLTAHFA
jgi:hypothetical protein